MLRCGEILNLKTETNQLTFNYARISNRVLYDISDCYGNIVKNGRINFSGHQKIQLTDLNPINYTLVIIDGGVVIRKNFKLLPSVYDNFVVNF